MRVFPFVFRLDGAALDISVTKRYTKGVSICSVEIFVFICFLSHHFISLMKSRKRCNGSEAEGYWSVGALFSVLLRYIIKVRLPKGTTAGRSLSVRLSLLYAFVRFNRL
jgi:hypothetical protein